MNFFVNKHFFSFIKIFLPFETSIILKLFVSIDWSFIKLSNDSYFPRENVVYFLKEKFSISNSSI